MNHVTQAEFDAHVIKTNAVPDGFKLNGSMMQTKYHAGGREVARRSEDGFGVIYEIEGNTPLQS